MRTFALLLLSLALQGPPRAGMIEGYVVRAGTDPPAILVNARLVLDRGGEERIARTDSTGRFIFSELAAGLYRLRVTKDGYLRQEYPHAAMSAPGLPLELEAGQERRNIVFRLDGAPTVSGVIRDASNAPVAGVLVQALRRGYDTRGNRTLSMVASARTDDKGNYRLYWLDTGEYFISAIPSLPPQTAATFSGRTPTSLATTYFPGFSAVDDAKSVRLESARDANGIDFALTQQPVGPVHGAVTSMTTGRYAAGSVLLATPEDGTGVARFQTRSVADPTPPTRDNYSIPNISPGGYILSAVSGEERGARRILVRSWGLTVDLELGPGIGINGRLAGISSATDLRGTRIGLAEMDTALPGPPEATVETDGTFVVAAVQPGSYSVNVKGLPENLYVRAASFAGVDVLEKPLSVAYRRAQDPRGLTIQIANDGGRIAGAVFDQTNMRFPAAQITLIPEGDARSSLERYRTAISGPDGSFTIRGIAPGDYRLFGWNNLEPNAYLNLDYMKFYQDFGTPIHIEPGQSGSVSLRLIQPDR